MRETLALGHLLCDKLCFNNDKIIVTCTRPGNSQGNGITRNVSLRLMVWVVSKQTGVYYPPESQIVNSAHAVATIDVNMLIYNWLP